MKVIINGGGLGGLGAAIALKKKGHQVTVLEAAPELSEVRTHAAPHPFAQDPDSKLTLPCLRLVLASRSLPTLVGYCAAMASKTSSWRRLSGLSTLPLKDTRRGDYWERRHCTLTSRKGTDLLTGSSTEPISKGSSLTPQRSWVSISVLVATSSRSTFMAQV